MELPDGLINGIFQYLATKPFNEVSGLIDAIKLEVNKAEAKVGESKKEEAKKVEEKKN